MTARTHVNSAEFNVAGGGRRMLALVDSGAVEDFEGRHFDALQARSDLAIQRLLRFCDMPKSPFGQDGKPIEPVCHDRSAPDEKAKEYGLRHLGIDFEKYPEIREIDRASIDKQDVFLQYDEANSRLQTFIECTTAEVSDGQRIDGYHLIPQCDQYFVSQRLNAIVSVSYRRVYLRDWAKIQREWQAALDSFLENKVAQEGARER
jgi:hypothetical protein